MKLVLAVLPILVFAQQRDAGVPPVTPAGSGEIAGIVVSSDANPQPIRRAVVTLTGAVAEPRSVLTDDAGRFTFAQLPAGTFSVTARKAAYPAAPYGAKRPGRTGTSIALAASQKTNLTIAMFKGAVITGTLRNSAGLPVGGVDVRVIDARTLLTMPDSSPVELATTDDRGAFRIYGLLPGDYYVVALPPPGGQGEIVAPSTSYLDTALSMLASRQTIRTAPAAPATTAQARSAIGFAPIFFPGTPNHVNAARVHVDIGEERAGVDFELNPVRMASIEGIVSGDVPNLATVQVTIIPSGPRVATGMSSNSLSGRPIDAQGRFRYSNLPPGSYRLVARARRGDAGGALVPTAYGGAGGRGGAVISTGESALPAPTGDYLYGVADVELRGEDVAGVSLVLQPGGVISGRIAFNGAGATAKPEDLTKIRASVSLEGAAGSVSSNGLMMGTGLLSSPISSVKADGTFEIRSIGPGRFTLNVTLPLPADAANWKLRLASAAEQDLLDGILDLGPGIEIKNVAVVFSDVVSEVSGLLQSGSGEPTTDFYIVALPADRALWRPGSRRIVSTKPATDGRFLFSGLLAGEYLIAALTDLDPIDLMDSSFLEQIAQAAIKLTLAEGEKKRQDLKIR